MPGVGGTLFGGAVGSPMSGQGETSGPAGGKNATSQNLGSPHSGLRSTITKGEPMSRAMGHYGKGHSFSAPTPTPGQGQAKIRGASGQIGHQLRYGGLGPGKMATAGGSNDYSMSSPDTE